jgi:uncharacterized membrane protein
MLTLTETSGATGTYNLTVTAKGGGLTKTQAITLTVTTPSFTLTPGGTSVTVAKGGSIPVRLTAAAVNGFKSVIVLSVSGMPKGVTTSFAPISIASPGNGTSTLTLKAASTTTVGTYNVTVLATGGGITKTQTIALKVAAPAASH